MIVPRAAYSALWFLHPGLRRLGGGRIGTRAARGDSSGAAAASRTNLYGIIPTTTVLVIVMLMVTKPF